jgi:hypothetical protein
MTFEFSGPPARGDQRHNRMNERRARDIPRENPKTKRLASGDVVTTWAGPGSGRLCSGCSRSIDFTQVECEVELRTEPTIKTLRFHTECYSIWSGEHWTA